MSERFPRERTKRMIAQYDSALAKTAWQKQCRREGAMIFLTWALVYVSVGLAIAIMGWLVLGLVK